MQQIRIGFSTVETTLALTTTSGIPDSGRVTGKAAS